MWLCASDELTAGLVINGTPKADGIIVSVDDFIFSISKPDRNSEYSQIIKKNRVERRI